MLRNNGLYLNKLEQSEKRFRSPLRLIEQKSHKTAALAQRLKLSQKNQFTQLSQQFNSLGEQLNLVSPLATINRGFAIARDQDDVILRSTEQVKIEQSIEVQLSDGTLDCMVTDIKNKTL